MGFESCLRRSSESGQVEMLLQSQKPVASGQKNFDMLVVRIRENPMQTTIGQRNATLRYRVGCNGALG